MFGVAESAEAWVRWRKGKGLKLGPRGVVLILRRKLFKGGHIALRSVSRLGDVARTAAAENIGHGSLAFPRRRSVLALWSSLIHFGLHTLPQA